MDRDRRRGEVFWTPAPLSPPSSDASEGGSAEEEEEEEQGHSGQDHSRLGKALDRIRPEEEETGPDGAVNMSWDHCQLLPTEGDNDRLDPGLRMIGADLVFSDEEDSNRTPSRCLSDPSPEEHRASEDPFHSHHSPHPTPRAPSLPRLLSPAELSTASAIVDELLPDVPSWDSSTDSQISPRSCEKLTDSNSRNAPAEKSSANKPCGHSKIPVKAIRRDSPEETCLRTASPPKAGSGRLKSSRQSRASPVQERTKARGSQDVPPAALLRIPNVLRPDLSRVEPRVRFPKDGYTPPRSRCPLRDTSLPPEPPLVFKSPADIVKEVLLAPDPDPEESVPVPDAISIVPPEFRSRQEATVLMDELQEDNYRLKIMCAEKANIIDQLRLEGKVNLFSEPPKPGLPLCSGLRTQASLPLTVEIPRTHRAQFSSSHQTETSTSTSGRSCADTFDGLYQGAQQFLHNIVSVLGQNLDILEKCYLLAKKEHSQQQCQCEDMGTFDPQRELESLIFQCGQRMDELKEDVRPATPPTHHPSLPFSGHSAGESTQHGGSQTSTSKGNYPLVEARIQKQAQSFLKNLTPFEAILQNGNLQTELQMKVLFELKQKMDALEKDYVLAKEEHKRQKMGSFDPRRDVEALVLLCGQQMDQLRDGVQSDQNLTTPSHASPIHQAPPTSQTMPSQGPPIHQAPPTSQTMLIQTTSIHHVPPTSLTTPIHAPPASLTTPIHAPPTSLTTPNHAPPTSLTIPIHAPPTSLTTLNHAPPTSLITPNHAPPTSLITPNHAPPTSLITPNHAPPTSLITPNQAPPTNLITPNQAPPTNLTTPNYAPFTILTAPAQAPPIHQAQFIHQTPPTNLTTPIQAPLTNLATHFQAPVTSLTTPTQGPPIHQAPPNSLTTPTQYSAFHWSPPTNLTTSTQLAPPTGLNPPMQQATPTLSSQTPPLSGTSTAERTQFLAPSTPSSMTVKNSVNVDQNQALRSLLPKPRSKGGADEPDSTQLYQSLKVLPKPLVCDLSEVPCHGPVITAEPEYGYDEGRRLSMGNTQTPHRSTRKAYPSPGPSALPKHPAVRSRLPSSLPLSPPSHGASSVGHPTTRGPVDLAQTHGPSRGGSEVGPSPSSSLSSLGDDPERKEHKPLSKKQRGFAQDGVISPETDSGFMGSEGSRMTPAAAASPVHQMEPPGVAGRPLVAPCPAPALSKQGLLCWRSRRGERRRTSAGSNRAFTTTRAADRESSVSGHDRPRSSSTSEEDQTECSSDSALSSRRQGDLRKVPRTGRGARHNETLESLQAEVFRLKINMDTFVRSRDRAEGRQPSTSTPVSRSDRHKAGYTGRRERPEPEEDAILLKSQTEQRKSVSNKTSQTDPHFPDRASRLTQTSDLCDRSETLHTRPLLKKTNAEERQSRSRSPVCPECKSRGKSQDGSLKGNPLKYAAHCPHCRLCAPSESDWFSPRDAQAVPSHRPVHCVPVCPHHLLLYSYPPPVHLSPTKSEGAPRLRGLTEGRSRRSVPAEGHASLDTSLNRALRAAWTMKSTSRHMVHTLASGLQYQRSLHHTR